jgi:hypothetical protein
MRGFGAQIDTVSGLSRNWYIDKHGVRRWHDNDSIAVRELPFDVARCSGVGSDEEGWRDGCDVCFRRLSKGHKTRQPQMQPPGIIVFECEYLIGA